MMAPMNAARATPNLFASLVLVGLGGMGCAHNHQLEVDFPTHDASTCRGYIAWDAPHVDHVFLSLGGTGTQSLAFVQPTFEELLRTRPVAYMTLDKPGITAP